jgi:hypothetical protein
MASPVLVIAAGYSATTWDYLNDSQSVTYYPHADFSIADISWNHNAQGMRWKFEVVVGFVVAVLGACHFDVDKHCGYR